MVRVAQHAMSYFSTHYAFVSHSVRFTQLPFHKPVHKMLFQLCMPLTREGSWWRVEA
jgi:hypothetical protein